LKSLIKRCPTFFGAMLLVAMAVISYFALIALGQGVIWFVQLFCDYPVVRTGVDATPKMDLYVGSPILGLAAFLLVYLVGFLFYVIFFMVRMLCGALSEESRALGFWLSKRL
jgi:hypothetical protein